MTRAHVEIAGFKLRCPCGAAVPHPDTGAVVWSPEQIQALSALQFDEATAPMCWVCGAFLGLPDFRAYRTEKAPAPAE